MSLFMVEAPSEGKQISMAPASRRSVSSIVYLGSFKQNSHTCLFCIMICQVHDMCNAVCVQLSADHKEEVIDCRVHLSI